MAIDIAQTHTLLMAVEKLPPVTTFLRDRYFPTNEMTDIFATTDVLIEYRDGNRKLAPFVSPRRGGRAVLREGSYMRSFKPPSIKPQRTLTIDELSTRGFGEALMTKLTPEQREAMIILRDAEDLGRMITRREEAMAAEALTTNGCIMRYYDDNQTLYDEQEIRFYEEDSNQAIYTPSVNWDQESANILADIYAMSKLLTSRGLPATDLIVAPDVAASLIRNKEIAQLLDNRRMELGGISPEMLPAGAAKIARLNVFGRMIDVIAYDETYEDEATGTIKQYIPEGMVILTAPRVGRTLYGAVTQVEQADGQVHTYTGRRVPKYLSDAVANTRSLTLTACPLPIPNHKSPWITAKVQ